MKSLDSVGPLAAFAQPTRLFLSILKTGWIGFPAFLELLEKLIIALTQAFHRHFRFSRWTT